MRQRHIRITLTRTINTKINRNITTTTDNYTWTDACTYNETIKRKLGRNMNKHKHDTETYTYTEIDKGNDEYAYDDTYALYREQSQETHIQ